jgi:hypothetical protein
MQLLVMAVGALTKSKAKPSRRGGSGSGSGEDDMPRAARALRKSRHRRERPLREPSGAEKEILSYIRHVKELLDVEEGEPWKFHRSTSKINWPKSRGLQRCHYHVNHILALSLD